MIKKLKVLNEPFVLWFLSSVLIAFISWQYTEIQKNTAEQKEQRQVLKKANLELKLVLQDIKYNSSLKGDTTINHLFSARTLMQYNAVNETNQFYVPTLQNIMLEIDSRTKTKGLELYQSKVFKRLTALSKTLNRIFMPSMQPNDLVWKYLNVKDQENLKKLEELIDEIATYYTAANKNPKSDS